MGDLYQGSTQSMMMKSEHMCYICGSAGFIASRCMTDSLGTSGISIEEKLYQIMSVDVPNDRHSEIVCEECFSLLENITKQQNALYIMIQDINEKLNNTCQKMLQLRNGGDDSKHVLEAAVADEPESGSASSDAASPADARPSSPAEEPAAPPACVDCPGRAFSSAASLRRHRRKKHERHLSCPFCSRPVRETYLEMHILIKHSKTEKGYLCTLCDRSYESAKYLKVHLRTVHSDGKQYQCTECGRLLANRGSLHAHMQRHARSHQCSLCGRRFALLKQLETHARHHTGERPFLCTDCGKAFISVERLRKHAHVHAVAPTCEACDRVFASRAGLEAHRRTHSGDRPFACTVCAKTFKRAAHLSDHVASVHGEDRPFKCDQCERSFTLEPYLKRHQRLHGGQKPHGCAACGKRFFKKYNLQAHLKTHEAD
ncbi:oocyte zinc finger protein XlCOF6.1-like [Pollicipes pollicipes]|uniref:oocyte zinc finger protein XlCOF6.1-like n=1 Tax=Pollicipes pollicipes TaxID=41117 RepID=UPI0018856968|nr:oocyte zinc finger protein XlCOF6.1-like [Pollicipes pollicipes]